jgi:NitT/TauT family transport system substrate-binding protein
MTGSVRILAMRHASFYAPLIGTVGGGFLEAEGLDGRYGVRPADRNPFEMIRSGEIEVMQSAVSSSWARLERGEGDLPAHFAQINRRDGFWILGRDPGPFRWDHLEGRTILADHGPQPLAMLRYAASRNGARLDAVGWENAGDPASIVAAWKAGHGDYAHLQGPAPHVLAETGAGHVLTAVGYAMPEVAFSSLAAMPSFLKTPEASAFLRAYTRCLEWIAASGAATIAETLAPFFPDVDVKALAASIAGYKALGCWKTTPEIPRSEYDQALEVFEWNKLITRRHRYEDVVEASVRDAFGA